MELYFFDIYYVKLSDEGMIRNFHWSHLSFASTLVCGSIAFSLPSPLSECYGSFL